MIGDVVRVGAMLADFNQQSGQDDVDDTGLAAVAR